MSISQNSISSDLAKLLGIDNVVLKTYQDYQRLILDTANLKGSVDRLAFAVNELTGVNDIDVTIRMPDGTYKKIYDTQYRQSPPRISTVTSPGKFNRRSNYFFENFYNPQLFVSFDVSSQVAADMDRAVVKRLILILDTEFKQRYFDTILKGRNDLDYATTLIDLQSQGIAYQLDEEIVDLPVSIARYSGSFDVISISDASVVDSVTNETVVQREYRLSKITYTDNLSTVKDTVTLKAGDVLLRGNSTKYQVVSTDASKRKIILKRISGSDSIPVGIDVLSVYSELYSNKEIQVTIGKDEHQIIFFKSIDSNFEIAATQWSPGVAFYSNDLTIDTPAGKKNLLEYYHSDVLDFGTPIQMLAKERVISSIDGEIPLAPVLDIANFKVVVVNNHKMNSATLEEIRDAGKNKIKIQSLIDNLNSIIAEKTQALYGTKFSSEEEKSSLTSEIDTLINKRKELTEQYASVVQQIALFADTSSAALDRPKYRIRGFWAIPTSRKSNRTGNQEIIQFVVSYRYLRLDGNAPDVSSYDFIDNDGRTVKGYFTNWVEYKTDTRKKEYDYSTGQYKWVIEDVSNPEIVNINQLDIPMSPSERVEIRIKSISEAGWVAGNPLVSDWSDSVIIDFPEQNISVDESENIVKNAAADTVKVNLIEELNSRNIDLHLKAARIIQAKYYAHDSTDISSGFFNANGEIVTVYEKIKEVTDEISRLKASIEKQKGVLAVSLIDDAGNVYKLSQGQTLELFAGYYSELISQLPVSERKGAIITKVYTLVLENVGSSPLEFSAKYPGGSDGDLPDSQTGIWRTLPFLDTDYTISRKYDKVPLIVNMVNNKIAKIGSKLQAAPFQSSQLQSQFLYLRYTDIGLKKLLYSKPVDLFTENIPSNWYIPTLPIPGNIPFVWNGRYNDNTTLPIGNGTLSDFCIHVDHPQLKTKKALRDLNLPKKSIPASTDALYSTFRHSYFFNRDAFEEHGQLQLEYIKQADYTETKIYPDAHNQYSDKLGFVVDDRYLIGSKTCGSYLFLAPTYIENIMVNGTDYRARTMLNSGESSQIKIPLVFQFRMTDYYGEGSDGLGIVGGWRNEEINQTLNPTYSKKIGIDLSVVDETLFSFDVQVTAKYSKESLGSIAIPSGTITRRKEDLPIALINSLGG